MKETIFKEYDIRATFPTEIDEQTAYIIGRSYGSYIREMFDKVCSRT